MDLSRLAVPSISQDRIAAFGLDDTRVLDGLPGELWEGLALDEGASFLGTETVLLRVGSVPNPVHEKVAGEKKDEEGCAEGVRLHLVEVIGEVEGAVTVAEGNASQVPENKHEAPFLVIHVPKPKSIIGQYALHGRTRTSSQ